MPNQADAELLASICHGDLRALGILFDRHEPAVKRLIGRMGVAAHEIDDLVQLTFLDVARAAPRFDPALPVRSWLFGLAIMVVRRHRRSIARFATRVAKWATEPPPRGPTLPDDALDTRRRADQAARALARLSRKKQEVFVMVVLEGMRGEEAAEALGIPVATVWTRLHHARRELRGHLKESRS